MFDFVKFFSVSVAGTPLLLVVMGLVTWISKTFKLQGQQSLICSMLVGLVLGGMYQYSQGVPVDFAGWFALIIYGLLLGLFASGVYDTAKKVSAK